MKEKANVDWLTMLPELMEKISNHLTVKDFFAFRKVCKQWRSLPSERSNMLKFSNLDIWFLFHESCNEDSRYLLYSINNNPKPCTFYLFDLKGATILHSKFGWLIACKSNRFFLYNFFTLTKINLPDHAVYENQACTFTTLPTQKDCTVFIVTRKSDSYIEVSSCRAGGSRWKVKMLDIDVSELDVLESVHCCGCVSNYDGEGCGCGLKNRSIGIFDKEDNYLRYDYMDDWICFSCANFCRKGGYVKKWQRNIETLCGYERRRRRGVLEKEVLVDVCSMSYRGERFVRMEDLKWVVFRDDHEGLNRINGVKLAIIEPRFIEMEHVDDYYLTVLIRCLVVLFALLVIVNFLLDAFGFKIHDENVSALRFVNNVSFLCNNGRFVYMWFDI